MSDNLENNVQQVNSGKTGIGEVKLKYGAQKTSVQSKIYKV